MTLEYTILFDILPTQEILSTRLQYQVSKVSIFSLSTHNIVKDPAPYNAALHISVFFLCDWFSDVKAYRICSKQLFFLLLIMYLAGYIIFYAHFILFIIGHFVSEI